MSEVKSEVEWCWLTGIRQITLGLLCTYAKRMFRAAKLEVLNQQQSDWL